MQWSFQDLIALRQKPEEEYQIEEEELVEYAEHLGINLPQQMYLFEIAEQGYSAKLPQQWIACKAPDDNIVYYNKQTKKIIEEHPMDQVYRRKVIQKRMQFSKRSEDSSSQNQAIDELSEIIEDEQQIANDSEIYERKASGYRMQDLRKPVSLEDFSYLRDARHKNSPKQAEVSAWQRNITMQESENISKNEINSNKILPSSLLDNFKNNFKSSQQFSLNQYQTRFSQKIESHQQNRKSSDYQSQVQKQENQEQTKKKEVQLLRQLQQELYQIERQQKLKENILKNLQKDNGHLLQKIRKKINRHKKQKKTKKC